jgi:hypothetical protein
MAPPPRNIPAEVEAKWLALRQKHQDESNNFQRLVAKNRAEFEDRAEKARKALLAKHLDEERGFWSNNDQDLKDATSTIKSAQVQTPGRPNSSAATSRIAPPPTKTSVSSSASPRRPARLPVTPPPRASSLVKLSQAPPRPTKPNPRRTQNKGVSEVINLCSDDEEDSTPTKKTPVVRKATANDTVRQQSIVAKPIAQEFILSDQVYNTNPIVPEATLQFFDGTSANYSVSDTTFF